MPHKSGGMEIIMKKIVLTGGGTAGHVTPNIALLPKLKEAGFEIEYIGSYNGIERKLITAEDIPYRGISTGKLRRYFDIQNFLDPFRVLKGFFEARKHLQEIQPNVVFSKGGFVSVPVVIAAQALKIPTVIHESDMTPGLANRIAMRNATKVCHTFPETGKHLGEKAVFTGSPIRAELFEGDAQKARKMCGFSDTKPVLLVMGGSLGAKSVNDVIRLGLVDLLKQFNVAHLCGEGKYDTSLDGIDGYAQFEYISEEMKDFFAMSDIIVSRAGSNSICEITALKKPNVLIPLSRKHSRGDQILNAASYSKLGFSEVINEDTMTEELVVDIIYKVYNNRKDYIEAMSSSTVSDSISIIVNLLSDY